MFCMVGLKTQSFFFKFLDPLKDSIVLFKIDVKLYFRGFVFWLSSEVLLIGVKVLKDLEGTFDDSFDGSIFIDFLGDILWNFFLLHLFVSFLRDLCWFFIIDFLDIVSGDDDFFFIERFLSIEVFNEGQSFF